jgi:hypothetical protein
MTRDSWLDLLDTIDEKFGIERKETAKVEQPTKGQQEIPGTIERVFFSSGGREMRLDFVTRPVVLDKHAHFRRSSANKTRVEYTYSETETTHKLTGYIKEGGEWQELSGVEGLL